MDSELCFKEDQMFCPHAESERRSYTKSTEHKVYVESRKLPNVETDIKREAETKFSSSSPLSEHLLGIKHHPST